MSKVLVTGACGFIGSNVSQALMQDGHSVWLLDNLSRQGSVSNLMWLAGSQQKIYFKQGDVSDFYFMKKAVENAEVIVHLAGQTAVVGKNGSIGNPQLDFQTNVVGTFNILEAARKFGNKPLIVYASTNKVYGNFDKNLQIDELQSLDFHTPYGCSKGAADQYMLDYYRTYDIPTVVLRMSCIYGNRQFGIEEQGWLAHFMKRKVQGKGVTIFGDGSQVRDVLYIDDYVQLIKALIQNKDKVAGQAFNIGGGLLNSISVKEVVEKIGIKKVNYGEWRIGDQKYYVSDISKIKKFTGWEPQIGVEEGLQKLEEWIKSQ